MISPTGHRFRAGLLRHRIRVVGAVLVAAFVLVSAWLGWPRRDFVEDRRTQLSRVEAGAWTATAGFQMQSVRLEGANGLSVSLRVLRPGEDQPGPHPGVVLLGGHRTGRDAVELVGDPEGLAIIALDYPYDGPERIRGFLPWVGNLPRLRRALLDTPAAVLLSVEWLEQQPWVDSNRLELAGVSLGAVFAGAAGAADPRFQRVWFVHGAGDLRSWLAHNLPDFGHAAIRTGAASLLWWIGHGASLDPEYWIGRIAPRRVVIVGARGDARLPPPLVEALHHAANEPKELVWTEGDHVNPRRPETVRPLIDLIQSRIQSSPPPSPTGN